jgi:L-seryl-tRNA(Ser) seleniumtransferase
MTSALELPEVRDAAEAAAHYFVNLFELQAAVGRRIAEIAGAEAALVTCGSSGAISAATAACIAGSDARNVYQLPDTTGMKNEVIILGGRSGFDSCIRLIGAKLIVVHSVDALQAAITPQTAMIYTTQGTDEELKRILTVTKPTGVPVMCDQASAIPPFSNFTRMAKTGVDLFCFSGGKGMRGPQSSGVLLGRKDLIEAAMYNSNPWEGSICRPMKVGKEEMMGCLAAVEYWAKADEVAINKNWQRQVERIATLVETVPGVQTKIVVPPTQEEDSWPLLSIWWDEKKFGLTIDQCATQLREGTPRIEVPSSANREGVMARIGLNDSGKPAPWNPKAIEIKSLTLQPGDELIVGNRLRQILEKARKQSA